MPGITSPIAAIIWDFDGTILDTEWPAFVAAEREFERYGATLELEEWAERIGTANYELWWESLRREVGGFDEDDDTLLARYRLLKNELTDASPLMAGVQSVFDQARELDVPCAVASSSPVDWVERHTRRLGLWDNFVAVATRTDVGRENTKPKPDLFLLAAERAGFDPATTLVIEDSVHGITAANAAGMYSVAVPNKITQIHDFSHANLQLSSLDELRLSELVA